MLATRSFEIKRIGMARSIFTNFIRGRVANIAASIACKVRAMPSEIMKRVLRSFVLSLGAFNCSGFAGGVFCKVNHWFVV